ncbi:sodium-dependent transporter [Corynebacterium pacaense]|uniref:sodium-dependent transporter n=1 Tax=Corynebacterium pacaense TaxID=1816684 RepID=UPI0009BB213E|nr:sodium-dependent transporter [Corynebacterium pacaense]
MTESTQAVKPKGRESWSGRPAFIVAAISSAIGLGNIWRFPGVAYENGGGAFLLPYLAALLTAGLPILFLDFAVGHRFRAAPPLTFRRISRKLEPLGWWQTIICFVISTYYAVILAWALCYIGFSVKRSWGDDAATFFAVDFLRATDPGVTPEPVPLIMWSLIAIWIGIIIVAALGLRKGLQLANRITLPTLVILFLAIVIYALTLPGAVDGLNTFFTPSWSALADPKVWIAAYGHIFFSFSIAFGIMLSYSSYLKRRSDLTGSGLVVAFANTSFELLAGIGVFAALGFLAYNQSVAVADLEGISGVGLAFITFPTLLSQMPGGQIVGVLFFLSLLFAGFTSLLSLMQVVIGSVADKTGWTGRRSAIFSGAVTGIASLLLYSSTAGLSILDVIDAFINNIGVVSSAIVMVIALGWGVRLLPELRDHINAVSSLRVGKLWMVMIRFITPAILIAILITGAWSYVVEGYGGYPTWFLLIAGWLMLVAVGALSLLLSFSGYGRAYADDYDPTTSVDLNNPSYPQTQKEQS